MKLLSQAPVQEGVDPAAGVSTLSAEDVVNIFDRFATWMFDVFVIVAIIAILITAFMYLTAGGKEEGIRKATRSLVYATVAMAAALLAWGLVKLVAELVRG